MSRFMKIIVDISTHDYISCSTEYLKNKVPNLQALHPFAGHSSNDFCSDY